MALFETSNILLYLTVTGMNYFYKPDMFKEISCSVIFLQKYVNALRSQFKLLYNMYNEPG